MDYIINANRTSDDDMIIDDKNTEDSPVVDKEVDDSNKPKGRFAWLLDWEKWSDLERAKIFAPLFKSFMEYRAENVDVALSDCVSKYSFETCRDFDMVVNSMFGRLAVKSDMLQFKPVDVYKIPEKYSEYKEKIIQWGKDNGYLT